MNPAIVPRSSEAHSAKAPYITRLHTNVPALFDSSHAIPAALIASRMRLIGSEEKYAASPPGEIGSSVGEAPSLSGIDASIIFIATRSGVIAARPPASPRQMIACGRSRLASRSSSAGARPKDVGRISR